MNNKGNKDIHLTIEDRINILNELIKGTKLSLISEKIIKIILVFSYLVYNAQFY